MIVYIVAARKLLYALNQEEQHRAVINVASYFETLFRRSRTVRDFLFLRREASLVISRQVSYQIIITRDVSHRHGIPPAENLAESCQGTMKLDGTSSETVATSTWGVFNQGIVRAIGFRRRPSLTRLNNH